MAEFTLPSLPGFRYTPVARVFYNEAPPDYTVATRRCPTSLDILVVDDNPLTLEWLMLAAKLQGFRCLTATNMVAAFEVLKIDRPLLILTDVHLHDAVDGFELTRRLKRNLVTREIPIVVYSNVAVPNDARHATEAGAETYIVLPSDVAEFGRIVRKYARVV